MMTARFVAEEYRPGDRIVLVRNASTVSNRVPRQNRIKRMFEAGLNIVLGTDDPAMFATTMGHCWRTLFAASKWHVTEARRLSLAGIDASWVPEPRKCELRREFEAALVALEAVLDPADRELDLAIERPPPQWP
jgi:Adenosine deaminase